YMTLYTVLESFTRLSAPFIPFATEAVYQNMVRSVDKEAPDSVHLCSYPVADESLIDTKLEQEMDLVRKISELGRSAREAANIKIRQPLSEVFVVSDIGLDKEYEDIVLGELNIKKLTRLDSDADLMDFSFKPQLRTCGRKFGPKLNAAKEVIANLPGKETMAKLEEGSVTITVDGEDFEMTKDDFLVETVQPEGLSTQSDRDVTVSLKTALTDELIEEGYVREMISKLQNLRKSTGLEVTDRIVLNYSGNDMLAGVIEKNKDTIASVVLATEIAPGEQGTKEESDINGQKIFFSIRKA
ncbi:MAG: class I tRNA ligase family protein, partial [Clostridiales bacterium]|nr:class I tRNA ligase family protein [Clostridiales bacterium]